MQISSAGEKATQAIRRVCISHQNGIHIENYDEFI